MANQPTPFRRVSAPIFGWLIAFLLASTLGLCAEPDRQFEPSTRSTYLHAKSEWAQANTNLSRAWEFARAAFDMGEFATNDTQRATLAREGIEAARKAIELDAKSAAAHYYLAMNLGQLARTQTLGALRSVDEMEAHFKKTAELDPSFDYAGADRNLGILYREAPGWPASVGSRTKARAHLEKSVKLSPEYPANHLELLQALVDWKEKQKAQVFLKDVQKCLSSARERFAGEKWEWSWDDWNRLWSDLQSRVEKFAR